jgi:hypothetical protein
MTAIGQGDAQGRPVLIRQQFLGGAGIAHQAAQDAMVRVVTHPGLGHDPLRQGTVHVIAAKGGVPPRSQHLEDTPAQAQDGDIEGAAPQVVDGVKAIRVPVQAIGDRRRRGLVEQTQDLEPGQAGGVLGGLALSLVEIGRYRDDHPGQIPPQGGLGAACQNPEDLGGDLHWTDIPRPGTDARHRRVGTDEFIRQLGAEALHIRDATANQALGGSQSVQRILYRRCLGLMADHQALLGVTHHRG